MNSFTASVSPDLCRPKPWLASTTLAWREIVRFFRQRNRVVGAVGQPILFWFLFGAGMNRWFQVGDQNFSQYYLPGTLMLILLFTAIFATISIIEDRREGFLQSVLVAPIPRWSMVLGKVLGGASVAVAQGLIFLCLAMLFGMRFDALSFISLFFFMSLAAIALTCLGFVIAWRLDSTQGFHAIMNLLLMPMWLLSGAFFPIPMPIATSTLVEVAFHWIMRLNPVTYGVGGIRQMMFDVTSQGSENAAANGLEHWTATLPYCWAVTLVFAAVMFAAACKISHRQVSGDLL